MEVRFSEFFTEQPDLLSPWRHNTYLLRSQRWGARQRFSEERLDNIDNNVNFSFIEP